MGTKVLNFVFDYPKKLPNRGEIIRDFLANSKAMEYLAIYKFQSFWYHYEFKINIL